MRTDFDYFGFSFKMKNLKKYTSLELPLKQLKLICSYFLSDLIMWMTLKKQLA